MTQKAIWRLVTAVPAIVLLGIPPSFAQTTGRIAGTVSDMSGARVPGATVTVGSPSLQGTQSDTTNAAGEYRFPALPPGTYAVKVTKSGFRTVEQTAVVVGLDRTVTLAIELDLATAGETITVTGEAPVVDTVSTTTGVNATAELFNRIPVERDIYRISRVAPGTEFDGVGTVFYGSSGAENAYIIDGLNVTGAERGQEIKHLNFDFVQEIEVKTGGLTAEYGRMTGGIVNVLTKSGGNELHGSLFGFNQGGWRQADNVTAARQPATTTAVFDIDTDWDIGGELGGAFIKDKLWFFAAYDRWRRTYNTSIIRALSTPGSPAQGAKVPDTFRLNLFSGKVTYRLAGNQTLTASVFGDPAKEEGNIFVIAGPPSTWEGTRETGSTNYVGRYDGTFGSRFLVRAMYGRHQEERRTGGPGRSIPLVVDQTVTPNPRSGGFGFFQDSTFERDVIKLDLAGFLGAHDVKLGGDFERLDARIARSFGGGQQIARLIDRATGSIYYSHVFFVNDQASGFDRSDPATWILADPLTSEPHTRNLSAYLQDSWRVTKGFTLNLGLRWEQQDIRGRDHETAFKLSDNWAPRLGFVWDVAGNGRSKVYAHFGRFYENIPLNINIRAFGGELAVFAFNFDPSPTNPRPHRAAPSRSLMFGSVNPVDPDLEGQYIDEYLAGAEYEVARNLAMGVKVTHRRLGRVIEDLLVPSTGEFSIGNPGSGIATDLAFFDAVHTAPAPRAKRKAWAVELTARKRFAEGWQILASYVWNRLDGNYDGLFQRSTGQLDPNFNSAFDFADFLVNAEGRLSVERRHQLKFDGSYEFHEGLPNGLNVGLSAYYFTGPPLTAYGYSFSYGNHEYYLVPRGSLGHAPAEWEANVNLSYPIKLGRRARLNLVVDIFNIFDRQAIFVPDQRYNLTEDGPCAGIPSAICNGDGGLATRPGTLIPLGTIANPRATATNPDFLEAGAAFTGQRSIRLGARFTF